jgi:PAS domain S-box-containing protein
MTDSKTLLLVEDEEAHAELVRRAFAESDSEWNINHVSNLEDAFRWLDENDPPSIIIADYRLPDGDGLELTGGAEKPEDVGIPLIILTAYGTEELAVRSLKSGAMDYVVKSAERFEEMPWIVERTLREWENIVERKKAEEELVKLKVLENFVAYLKAMRDFFPDTLLILDENGSVSYVNPGFEEDFGYTKDECVGLRMEELAERITPEGERAFIVSEIREILESGEKIMDADAEAMNREGEQFSMKYSVSGIFDTSNRLIGTIISIRNTAKNYKEYIEAAKKYI